MDELAEGDGEFTEEQFASFSAPAGLYGPPPEVPGSPFGMNASVDDPEVESVAVLYGPPPDDDIPADLYGPPPEAPRDDYPNHAGDKAAYREKNHKPSSIKDIWRVWREMRGE